MKKQIALLALLFLLGISRIDAQIFWVENFGTSTTSGAVTSFTSSNGTWPVTNLAASGSLPNLWYVSCQEQGYMTGTCGADCTGPAGLGSTLHIGSATGLGGDMGASYFAGPGGGATNRRAESPTINCSGHSNITLSFYYIENGDAANDDGSVYYYDGTTWALLLNTAKTTVCSGGQGQWAHASIALPASANNNPNVKIGFLWVNNADGIGTDPSYAIDSMSLSTPSSSSVTVSFTKSASSVCQDSCITFTNTSAGAIDSIHWSIPGVSLLGATASPLFVCFHIPGTYPVKLYAHHGAAIDSSSSTVTINNAPHPVLIQSGHTLTVSGTYTS